MRPKKSVAKELNSCVLFTLNTGLKDNKRRAGWQNWRPEWCSDAGISHQPSFVGGKSSMAFHKKEELDGNYSEAGVSRYKTARAPTEL